MKLIGIVGRKRSGKDTIAEYLIEKNQFQRYSFADPLKKGVMAMFGFTEAQMWGSTEDKETVDPRWGISPRRMLQLVGTELFQFDIRKHLNENEFPVGREVWVHRFKLWYDEERKKIENEKTFMRSYGFHVPKEDSFNIVIADVRFPHEAKAITDMGGEIWRVERPSIINNDNHASEKEQDSIIANITIINDGSLDDLYNKIKINLSKNLVN